MTISKEYRTKATARRVFHARCEILHEGRKSGEAGFMTLALVENTIKVMSNYHNEITMKNFLSTGKY